MKYVEEYLETVVKIKPLGELTTKEDVLYDMSGEMVYIDGKCSDTFISHADYANWLEKQGEQKPNDKVEPKFKVGNWYQCTKDFFGKGVTFDKNTAYYCAKEGCLQNKNGCHIAIVKNLYDNFKLWTINDAKGGDVLAVEAIENYPYPFVAIYKEHCLDFFNSYCFIGFNGKFYESETGHSMDEIHPATKEQCNLLFAKMKEFGYEWDAEKKELKKIEQKPTQETKSFEVEHGKYYYCIKDYFCGGKKQASKGDVIQALRGLPIMGLKDASEYFLPVNSIKEIWSEDDKETLE